MRRSATLISLTLPCLLLAACGPERTERVASGPTDIRCEGSRTVAVGDSVGQVVFSTNDARVARGVRIDRSTIATVPSDGR